MLAFLLDNYLVKNDHKTLDNFMKEFYNESRSKFFFDKIFFIKSCRSVPIKSFYQVLIV